MKKKFLILIFSIMIPILFLTACGNNNGNNNSNNDPIVNTISLSYMKNLMVDANGATAYGIKKSQQDNLFPSSTVSLMSAKVVNNDNRRENNSHFYLYKTTEDYEYGNVEYDENKITKVTFKKNTSVTENVYDKEGNIINSSTMITQDELDANINKVYTTKQYTYLQFVVDVESSGNYNYYDSNNILQTEYVSIRPDSLTYDENGVAEFDKTDYYSSNLTASFVIDNETGYIYKIDGFYIKSLKNGLVLDKNGYYYSVKTDAESNLVFTDIMPNKEVSIKGVATDNEGYIFVCNAQGINNIDKNNKIIYYDGLSHDYMIGDNGVVYSLESEGNVLKIKQKFLNGEFIELSPDEYVFGLHYIWEGLGSQTPIAYYKGYDIYDFYPADNFVGIENSIKIVNESDTYVFRWLNLNCIVFTTHTDYFYYKMINIDECLGNDITIHSEEFILLSNEKLYETTYNLQVGNDLYKQTNVYKSVGINGTEYYKLVKDTDGLSLIKLESKEYDSNIFILQPINK